MIRSQTCPNLLPHQSKTAKIIGEELNRQKQLRARTSKRRTQSTPLPGRSTVESSLPPIERTQRKQTHKSTGSNLKSDRYNMVNTQSRRKNTGVEENGAGAYSNTNSKMHDSYKHDETKINMENEQFFITQTATLHLSSRNIPSSISTSNGQRQKGNSIKTDLKGIKTSSTLVGLPSHSKTYEQTISVPGGIIRNERHRVLNGNCPLIMSQLPSKTDLTGDDVCSINHSANMVSKAKNGCVTSAKTTVSSDVKINNAVELTRVNDNSNRVISTSTQRLATLDTVAVKRKQSLSRSTQEKWAMQRNTSGITAKGAQLTTSQDPETTNNQPPILSSVTNRSTHRNYAYVYDESRRKSRPLLQAPTKHEDTLKSSTEFQQVMDTVELESCETESRNSITVDENHNAHKVDFLPPTVKNLNKPRYIEKPQDKGLRILKWILAEQTRKITDISESTSYKAL